MLLTNGAYALFRALSATGATDRTVAVWKRVLHAARNLFLLALGQRADRYTRTYRTVEHARTQLTTGRCP